MHIMVSWDIKANGTRWNEINDSLKEGFNRYSSQKVFPTLYIVKLNGPLDRNKIYESLVKQANQFQETIYFLVSPAMFYRYDGSLPADMWTQINQMTD